MREIQECRLFLAKLTTWCWIITFSAFIIGIIATTLSYASGGWADAAMAKLGSPVWLLSFLLLSIRHYHKGGSKDFVGAVFSGFMQSIGVIIGLLIFLTFLAFGMSLLGSAAKDVASVFKYLVIPTLGWASLCMTGVWFACHIWLLFAAVSQSNGNQTTALVAKLTFEAGEELISYVFGELLGQSKTS